MYVCMYIYIHIYIYIYIFIHSFIHSFLYSDEVYGCRDCRIRVCKLWCLKGAPLCAPQIAQLEKLNHPKDRNAKLEQL